ncbi:MAG TPA: SpvB/TcaC N-terminal domain-containing protein, partial [Polyangiaceae bacterium]|nr:SpvB/TcaC N-terminal domain-containing protein [Polyangiaceae bacterium]
MVRTGPPGIPTPGETSGTFSVTADGQAAYSIPIWAPAGPLGLQPSISLNYNSAQPNGPEGLGWSLSGFPLSQIRRCRPSIAIDGYNGPVDFNGEVFCLDGKRLIRVPGVDGSLGAETLSSAVAEYRPESNDQARVIALGRSAANPDSFVILATDGKVLTFGSSDNSKMKLRRVHWTAPDNTDVPPTDTATDSVFAWGLDEVKDTSVAVGAPGNRMRVTYQNLIGASVRYPYPWTFMEFLPERIDYAPRRSMEFEYKLERDDARYSFVGGGGVQSTRLLKSIALRAPNPGGSEVLKRYQLGYDYGPTSGVARLTTVTECDSFDVCKAPTIFEYEDGSSEFTDVVGDPNPLSPQGNFAAKDFDGDGRDDLVYNLLSPPPPAGLNVLNPFNSPFIPFGAALGLKAGDLGNYVVRSLDPSYHLREPRQFLNGFWYLESGRSFYIWEPGECHSIDPDSWGGVTRMAGPEEWVRGLEPVDINGDGRVEYAAVHVYTAPPDCPGESTFGIKYDPLSGALPPQQWIVGAIPGARSPGTRPAPIFEDGSDPVRINNTAGLFPLYFADLDGDGLPEAVEPVDHLPNQSGSRWTARKNEGGKLGRRLAVADDGAILCPDRNAFSVMNTQNIYVADIDGSGRQAFLFQQANRNFECGPFGMFVPLIPPVPNTRYIALTMTGSGAEYSRNVTGTTLKLGSKEPGQIHYLMIDVNGDGLTDALEVRNADGTSASPTTSTTPS